MTCPLDSLSTEALENLVHNVLFPKAIAQQMASLNLPDVCEEEPARDGETVSQKRCRLINGLIMLSRWFYCATQQDPEGCFNGECEDYADRVDACYPV